MERLFELNSDHEASTLYGLHDEHLKLIEAEFGVTIGARGRVCTVSGSDDDVLQASRLINQLLELIRGGKYLKREDVVYAIRLTSEDESASLDPIYSDKIEVLAKRRWIHLKTKGQKQYVDAMRQDDVVFAVGPAGTGKTYLAVAMAVQALKRQQVARIILTRPAVEAGESLGFLPGSFEDKVNPYLRPLYDALCDTMGLERVKQFIEKGMIEVAPLAYMRGRTLSDAFVILDEAQNCTPTQMKMFLTRLGEHAKMIITGDVTQSDLPRGQQSGLDHAKGVFQDTKGIGWVELTGSDVVRHEMVQRIIEAYAQAEATEVHAS